MELFEYFTLIGGIMIGMGIVLFVFVAAVAYFIGENDEPWS